MDTVFIRDLQLEATIGILAWERQIKQKLILQLDMGWNTSLPAEHDDFSLALDYDAVAKKLESYVNESEFELIETLTENIASLLLREFKLPWVRVELHKPGAVRTARSVGIIIERGEKYETL